MKKAIIATALSVLVIILSVLGVYGYIYRDFSVNGLDSGKFEYISDFDTESEFTMTDINAEFANGEIKSSSGKKDFCGVELTASICETVGSGSLVLRIHQKPSVYTPFNAEYISFAQRVYKDDGTENYVFPGHIGTDKNGEKVVFQPGQSDVEYAGEKGVVTDEYWIRDAEGNYLKAEDIEDHFPITVNLKGHKETYTRTSLF